MKICSTLTGGYDKSNNRPTQLLKENFEKFGNKKFHENTTHIFLVLPHTQT